MVISKKFKLLAIGTLLAAVAVASVAREHRSYAERQAFKNDNPCPSTGKSYGPCEGYQVDHVKALENGGADKPSNMQWLTIEQHREKTKIDNAEHRASQ